MTDVPPMITSPSQLEKMLRSIILSSQSSPLRDKDAYRNRVSYFLFYLFGNLRPVITERFQPIGGHFAPVYSLRGIDDIEHPGSVAKVTGFFHGTLFKVEGLPVFAAAKRVELHCGICRRSKGHF